MLRFLVVLPAFAILVGCATPAQREASQIVKTARETLDDYKRCLAPIESKPAYARIYEKLGTPKTNEMNRQPSQAQLSDAERISEADIALALSWYAETQQCSIPAIATFLQVDPEYQIYFADSQSEVTDIIREAVTDKPSWGHINQRVFALQLRNKNAATRITQKIQARLVAQHQEALQEREALAESATELAVNVLLTLATRQARLAQAQQAFAATHPRYQMNTIRTIKCNPNIQSTLGQSSAAAKAQIISNYAARGMNTDPRLNTSLAAELASAESQALISSVSTACSF
jgi:hypothetical protein